MYNIINAEELLDLNNKIIQDEKPDRPTIENKTKELYYGGSKGQTQIHTHTEAPAPQNQCNINQKNQNIFIMILFIIAIIYVIYKLLKATGKSKSTKLMNIKFMDFTKNHDIIKLLIGLMILNHVRLLSTSLINNLIIPLIEPIIPFLECNFMIKLNNSEIEIGKFMTDVLVFILNIFILYIIYIILHSILLK
jgi:large-conductance mechanosensitive channel